MLYSKASSETYTLEFKKRFENFCTKAPLLMSYTTTPTSVQIVDESTNLVYDVPFDFSIPVKSFIYGIKQLLIANGCYPILERWTTVQEPVSTDEQIHMATTSVVELDRVPTRRIVNNKETFRIDKCIVYHDVFIIQNLKTNEMFRYRLKRPAILFLKKMRTREGTPRDYGDYFFANSELLNAIVPSGE